MKLLIDIPEDAYHMICETTFTEDADRMFLQSSEDRLKTLLLFKALDSIKEGKSDIDNEFTSTLSKLRPSGQWVPVNADSRGYTETFECSYCKERIYRDHCMKRNDYPNCPYCLADMKI